MALQQCQVGGGRDKPHDLVPAQLQQRHVAPGGGHGIPLPEWDSERQGLMSHELEPSDPMPAPSGRHLLNSAKTAVERVAGRLFHQQRGDRLNDSDLPSTSPSLGSPETLLCSGS